MSGTRRRALVAAAAVLLLCGCDIAPGSNTSAGVVTDKRLHHGEMQVHVRYSDGHTQWSNVNGIKYRACKGRQDGHGSPTNYIKVDWNKQAAGKAKDYLGFTHFSRGGLIGQLEFDGFTRAQAVYAADQVGL